MTDNMRPYPENMKAAETPEDGAKLRCPGCGAVLVEEVKRCPGCGCALKWERDPVTGKSVIADWRRLAASGVYAGPELNDRGMVYAGPEMTVYAGPQRSFGMMIGTDFLNQQDSKRVVSQPGPLGNCQMCGSPIYARSKFCTECGAKLNFDD